MANDRLANRYQAYLDLIEAVNKADQPHDVWRRLRDGLRPLWPGLDGFLAVPSSQGKRTFRWRVTLDNEIPGREPVLVWNFSGWRLQFYGSPPPPELTALLSPLSRSLSRIVDRFELFAENRQLLGDVSFLIRIASASSDSSITEIYRQAFAFLTEHYRGLAGYAAFLESGGRLRIQLAHGALRSKGFNLPFEDEVGGQLALQQRQAVYGEISATFDSIAFENGPTGALPSVYHRLFAQARARSAAFLPVPAWSGFHGTIALFSRSPAFFSRRTRLVVEGVIAWVSSAVERSLHFEEERRLGEGIRYLSTIANSVVWPTFLGWCQEVLQAAGVWLLWEDQNLGADFWRMVAAVGVAPDLPELLPADHAEEYIRSSLGEKGLQAEALPLEREGVARGAWGWCRPSKAPAVTVPVWIYLLTDHLALTVLNLNRNLSLEAAAYRDQLTGLYNRSFLEKYLSDRVQSREPLSFAVLDLDHFKELNDSKGHDEGDEVLRLIAARLWEGLREHDLAVRLGGDEFVIILDGCPLGQAPAALQRIVAHLPLAENTLGMSGGVAGWPDQAQTYEELYRIADQALYQAKKAGRNVLVVAGETEIRPWMPTTST